MNPGTNLPSQWGTARQKERSGSVPALSLMQQTIRLRPDEHRPRDRPYFAATDSLNARPDQRRLRISTCSPRPITISETIAAGKSRKTEVRDDVHWKAMLGRNGVADLFFDLEAERVGHLLHTLQASARVHRRFVLLDLLFG